MRKVEVAGTSKALLSHQHISVATQSTDLSLPRPAEFNSSSANVMKSDDLENSNISTFIPLQQEVHSRIKYNGVGFGAQIDP